MIMIVEVNRKKMEMRKTRDWTAVRKKDLFIFEGFSQISKGLYF